MLGLVRVLGLVRAPGLVRILGLMGLVGMMGYRTGETLGLVGLDLGRNWWGWTWEGTGGGGPAGCWQAGRAG
jgi:hypothetical protein